MRPRERPLPYAHGQDDDNDHAHNQGQEWPRPRRPRPRPQHPARSPPRQKRSGPRPRPRPRPRRPRARPPATAGGRGHGQSPGHSHGHHHQPQPWPRPRLRLRQQPRQQRRETCRQPPRGAQWLASSTTCYSLAESQRAEVVGCSTTYLSAFYVLDHTSQEPTIFRRHVQRKLLKVGLRCRFSNLKRFQDFSNLKCFSQQNYRHLGKWGLVTNYEFNKVVEMSPRGY